jgi:S-methylmethionine-dependent homocysteine/selenocysteine methylase
VNCVSPRFLDRIVSTLRGITPLPIAVYGNVGLPEDDRHGWEFTHDVTEDEYALHALQWRRAGASMIGGCCGTTPGYIRALKRPVS